MVHLILLTVAAVLASEPPEWLVDNWDSRDGLPQNSITDIHLAQDGYLWVTTYGGIARFDGREFQVFHRGTAPGVGARYTSIAEAADGTLWFGSEEQGLYRLNGDVLEQVGRPIQVWDMEIDAQGQIWTTGARSVVRTTESSQEHMAEFDGVIAFSRLEGDVIIGHSQDQRSWCIAGSCPTLPDAPRRGIPKLLNGPNDDVVASIGSELYRVTSERWEPVLKGPDDVRFPISCVVEQQALWCAQGSQPFPSSQPIWTSVDEPAARVIMPDGEGGFWVGTDGGGLYHYIRRSVRTYAGIGALHIVPSPTGGWWYSTFHETYTIDSEAPPWGDAQAYLWRSGTGSTLAIAQRTLYQFSGDVVYQTPLEEGVTQVPVEGPCFARQQQLYEVDRQANVHVVASATTLGARLLEPIRCMGNGSAWVLLDRRRLVRLVDGVSAEEIMLTEPVQVRDVQHARGRVWVATYGLGLLAVQDGAIQHVLTPREGMCDFMVSRIFDTGDGALWFNTNLGLGRVPLSDLEASLQGDPVRCELKNSGEANGNGGFLGADGMLWVPTVNGISVVDSRQTTNIRAPRLHLARVSFNGETLTPGARVDGPGNLEIHFVGLSYMDPHALLYRYRLVGADERWSEASPVNQVRYPALQPGEYRFEVQVRGREGIWSDVQAFDLVRAPLWHERPAAQLGIPLTIVGVVLGVLLLILRHTIRNNHRLSLEIVERKRAEDALRLKQEEVNKERQSRESSRRLQALGRLAAGVAHDFNNLMTVLSVHITILDQSTDPEVKSEVSGLLSVLERATMLTRGLLLFGRRQAMQPRIIQLEHALTDLMPLLRRLIRADIQLHLKCLSACSIQIDPGQLDQIVTNLVLNARDAIIGPGVIQIQMRVVDGVVELQVEDNGKGMSSEVLQHLFEPYFTTKVLGEGTGLGMATVHGAVQEAQGTITVSSKVGEGTTVLLRFPLQSADAAPVVQERPPEPIDPQAMQVLIVDDRPEVLAALQQLTIRAGWSVYTATCLAEAVAVAHRTPLGLLLTDVVMPGGDGPAVQAAIRAIQPDLPTVFMTGYAGQELGFDDNTVVLSKPFTWDLLQRAVTQAMQNSGKISHRA